MRTATPFRPDMRRFQGLILEKHPTSGTADDDDDRDDEHADENEAPVRETDENTETPEEFEVDDEDGLGHPEDDDLDEQLDEIEDEEDEQADDFNE